MRRQKIIQSVLENTSAIQRAMATSRDHFLLGMGVNRPQLEALLILSKQPLSVKSLAGFLKITGGAATQMIDSLVAGGFVERFSMKSDRRSVYVQLTKEGKIKFEQVRSAYLERLSRILEPVSDEQLDKLLNATEQFLTQLNVTNKENS